MANREETQKAYERDQKGRNDHHHDGDPANHPSNQNDDDD